MTRHALDYLAALERAGWKHRIEDPAATVQTVVLSEDVKEAFLAYGREWALRSAAEAILGSPAVETIMGFPVVVDPTLPPGTLRLVSERPPFYPLTMEYLEGLGEYL